MTSNNPSQSEQVLVKEEELPHLISLRVRRADLKSSPSNGLVKTNLWGRILNRIPILNSKRIIIEKAVHGTEDTVLYCPETAACDTSRANPTEFVRVDPCKTSNLVYRGDEFEVSFIGMSATPQDAGRSNNNELFLYSLLRNEIYEDGHDVPNTSSSPNSSTPAVPTGIPRNSDLPFIHYDPVIDGHDTGTRPDSFVSIPASKRVYYEHPRNNYGDKKCEQFFNVRFTLMEIDKISDILARAPSSVDQLGSYVSGSATAVPYVELVGKALSVASALGKHGIKEYARPDHVLSTDAEFLLAEPENGLPQQEGDYLRYGFYFFLSSPVDAKVYAQTCSSSQYMPLLLKRENLTLKRANKNEKLFFPLTGVSYLVMKVSKGCKNHGFNRTRLTCDEHRKRLENMLQMRGVIEMLAGTNTRGKQSTRKKMGR